MLDLHPLRDLEEDSVESSRARTVAVASGIVVALIVALGVVLAVDTRGDGAGKPVIAASQPSASQSTRPSQSPSTPPQAVSPTDTAVPTAPPKGVTWSLFQGVALPSSATDGPARVQGPVYAGYSRTPTGALLAAEQIAARYLITPGQGWRQVVEQQVLRSSGRDKYVSLRAEVTDDSSTPGTYRQTAGFRFVTYSPDGAVIQVVSRGSSGNLAVVTNTVRWSEGDWKLELQPDGGTSPTRQVIPSLAGFIPWGGV